MSQEDGNNTDDFVANLLLQILPVAEAANEEKEEAKKQKEKYRTLLHKSDVETSSRLSKFMKELKNNITQGKRQEDNVILQLEIIKEDNLTHLLTSFPEDEMNPLQLAAFFYGNDRVIGKIVSLKPNLIWKQRTGEFKGQTVLHIVIVRQNVKGAEFLLDTEKKQGTGHGMSLLSVAATGSSFESTVMMGELPLSVAALTCNWEMVELLIQKGASFWRGNSLGDTVFHSLVRFADLHPDKLEGVKKTMRKLHTKIDRELRKLEAQVRDVWLIENKEGLTPLRLAVHLGQHELFKLILNLGGVYRHLDASEGLFDCVFYDITEVDPVAARRFEAIKKKKEPEPSERNGVQILQTTARTPYQNDVRARGMKREAVEEPRNISVLEIICEQRPEMRLFEIISTDLIREMIRIKWECYRARFIAWAVLHFLFMSLLSVHTIYRSSIIGDELKAAQTGKGERIFVITAASINLFTPIIVIPMEVLMKLGRKQPWKLTLLHHNGTYRLALITFSLLLFADAIWYLAPGSSQNYILVLSLLLGWWFMTFFLRPYKKFSFFTVMMQKVFVGDFLRFCVMIILMWIAFSVAMHSAYLATSDSTPPPEFQTIWKSAMTMFELVFGMADSAAVLGHDEWVDQTTGKITTNTDFKGLVIFLYGAFVLVTYLLLLNALIAMMANTCTSVSQDRDRQWQYQRLSVVLMIENMTPTFSSGMVRLCGEEKEVARFDFRSQRPYTEKRFFLKVKSFHEELQDEQKDEDGNEEEGENFHGLSLLAAFAKQQCLLDNTAFDDEPENDVNVKLANGVRGKRANVGKDKKSNAGKDKHANAGKDKQAKGKKAEQATGKENNTFVVPPDVAAALLEVARGGPGKQPNGDKTKTAGVDDANAMDEDTLAAALVAYAKKLDKKSKKSSGDKGNPAGTDSDNDAIDADTVANTAAALMAAYVRKTARKPNRDRGRKAKSGGRREDGADRETTRRRPAEEDTRRSQRSAAPMPEMPEVYVIAPKFDTQGESTM